ncbi:hypothetical protein JCM11641_007239 [Rhodosporidiobolus odoratus]
MNLTNLLACLLALTLSLPDLVQSHVTYGGGHHAHPANLHAQADPTHRRHHSKLTTEVMASVSNQASKASDAFNRVGRRRATDEEEPYGGEDVEPSQTSIVGNATSSGFATTPTSRRFPSDPSYHGPVTCENATVEKRGSKKIGWSLKGLTKNGVAIGFLPDDGSGGGKAETIEMIEAKLGMKAAAQGWYAQAVADHPFDGSQFEARKDQIRNSDGVFQATVMPVSWKGFTWEDNSQAIRVAKYLQRWVDLGKEVWLRFGHEVNYYQLDGTYQGTVHDFKLGWAVMAKARNDLAPDVKMWYTPNFATLNVYDKFYPDDPKTVDLIGVDWYPHQTEKFDFAHGPADMKKFHDKYCNERVKFAIGETGLGIKAPLEARLAWFQNILDAKRVMPNMIAISWFNYYKDQYSYKIVDDYGDNLVVKYLKAK